MSIRRSNRVNPESRWAPIAFATCAAVVAALSPHDNAWSQDCSNDGPHKKVALIIAISDYTERGWRPINSTNDIPLIKTALKAHCFKEENIKVVPEKDSTRSGIQSAIDNTLLPMISKGDIVYFHFSGHGQRIKDDNCDESDGFDETLVPRDAPMRAPASYNGDKHIRDDEVEQIIDRVRAAAGPDGDVVFAFDSCYSGTVARGFAPARGTEETIGEKQACESRLDKTKTVLRLSDDESLAPFVVFSASPYNQLARETEISPGKSVGSLSFALSSSLPKAGSATTYRGLFKDIEIHMAARVTNEPQLDGDPDREIFNKQGVDQESFYEVSGVRDNFVQIQAGFLRGVLAESLVEFHAPNTRRPTAATLIAEGKVLTANESDSTIELNGDEFDSDQLGNSWAFVTEPAFGSLQINVLVTSEDAAWAEQIEQDVSSSAFVTVDPESAAAIEIRDLRADGNTIQIIGAQEDNKITELDATDSDLSADIKKVLKAFAKNRFLRKLALSARGISGELSIAHCKTRCVFDVFSEQERCECTSQSPLEPSDDGNLQVISGERYRFHIKNTGLQRTYNYLIELGSTGQIRVRYPPLNSTGQMLQRGGKFEIPILFTMHPPLGTDVYLLVSSLDPIDFWPIETGLPAASKSGRKAFDLLMEESFLGNRGSEPTFPLNSASTNATVVRLVAQPESSESQ